MAQFGYTMMTEQSPPDQLVRDLVPILRGADAVVHLAWLIQPGRDESVTHDVNVTGSERVPSGRLRAAGAGERRGHGHERDGQAAHPPDGTPGDHRVIRL